MHLLTCDILQNVFLVLVSSSGLEYLHYHRFKRNQIFYMPSNAFMLVNAQYSCSSFVYIGNNAFSIQCYESFIYTFHYDVLVLALLVYQACLALVLYLIFNAPCGCQNHPEKCFPSLRIILSYAYYTESFIVEFYWSSITRKMPVSRIFMLIPTNLNGFAFFYRHCDCRISYAIL